MGIFQKRFIVLPLFGLLMAACGAEATGSDGEGSDSTSGTGATKGSLSGGGIKLDPSNQGGAGNHPSCLADNPDDDCPLLFEPAGPGCGDSEVNVDGEQCDDGNGLPGDGCNGACEIEPNWDCSSGTCEQTFECGNGTREGAEVCDDGNDMSGDGCSDECLTIDPFYQCAIAGGACTTNVKCGDGRVTGNEQCEDGDAEGGDGCSADCRLESGYYCPTIGSACLTTPFCGDGKQSGGEECDDKDQDGGDGCSQFCEVETGYACPAPGASCVKIQLRCGDGVIAGNEQCDDTNTQNGDGCSATCVLEDGFTCPSAGTKCVAICGDGKVRGQEACDDGGKANNDGCSNKCTWEPGFACNATPPHACTTDTCGNGKVGNSEACDLGAGKNLPGSGCAPDCSAEPTCTYGAAGCSSKCGDGLVIGEDCDDGNTRSGDGCSSTCKIETGFVCSQNTKCTDKRLWDHDNNNSTAGINTCVFEVPIIYFDVKSAHPHFEPNWNSSGTKGLVNTNLGVDGLPDWSGTDDGVIAGNSSLFDFWFKPTTNAQAADHRNTMVVSSMLLWDRDRVTTGGAYNPDAASVSFVNRWGPEGEKFTSQSNGQYVHCGNAGQCDQQTAGDPTNCTCHRSYTSSLLANPECDQSRSGFPGCFMNGGDWHTYASSSSTSYDGNPEFFPIDNVGTEFSQRAIPPQYGGNWDVRAGSHNFHFTSVVRRWFKYENTKSYSLGFTGDDDVWVFINGKLAVDLGGWHEPQDGGITISSTNAAAYNLTHNNVYEIAVFQAERKTVGSSYRLTLTGFNTNPSSCTSNCGDGIVASTEQCDDGVNAGGYGRCQPGCVLGPRCGDGSVTSGETCDNGVNLSGYNDGTAQACGPGCQKPARCGDGTIDFQYGEVCDNGGANSNAYGKCGTNCQLTAHCGDGQENGNEECDDGVNDGTAGCGPGCINTSGCGNGAVDPGEDCDDGQNDGGYNECAPECRFGPRCGDGALQSTYEECDDGSNTGAYGKCAPGCRLGPYCGDGVKNGKEGCDDGVNAGGYGKCGPTCQPSAYCGDGTVQGPREQCDDGARQNGDGCSSTCLVEGVVK